MCKDFIHGFDQAECVLVSADSKEWEDLKKLHTKLKDEQTQTSAAGYHNKKEPTTEIDRMDSFSHILKPKRRMVHYLCFGELVTDQKVHPRKFTLEFQIDM